MLHLYYNTCALHYTAAHLGVPLGLEINLLMICNKMLFDIITLYYKHSPL